MKNVKNLVICLAVLVLSAAFFTKPAVAATRLSGISVQSACDHQYPQTYKGTTITAVLFGKTVLNWYCQSKSNAGFINAYLGVDLSRECRRIYGSSAYAAYTSYYNPYSWGCYR